MRRRLGPLAFGLALGAGVGALAGPALRAPAVPVSEVRLPAFSKVAFLSHVNSPRRTPLFPGDPPFRAETVFTVAEDGFYLRYLHEGEHTGTHYSAPCHFHADEICAQDLDPADMVLPAVVIDVRAQVAADPDYRITVADLEAWEDAYGPMPRNAAVLARTGCSRYWGPSDEPTEPTYFNCGSGLRGFHQPGFSVEAVRWLLDRGVLGERGALGSDTFGPDPSSDPRYRASSLTLHEHRLTLENLHNLGELAPAGSWIVVGGPVNAKGSGAPAMVFGLIP
jgi:kynurenine formamidase